MYVCDGTRVLKDHVRPELAMLQQLGRPLVVLTDPDERGRELRLHLEAAIGPLSHAFVPEPAAAAQQDGLVHAAGNRGVEHVVPTGVQRALAAARQSYPAGRQVRGRAGCEHGSTCQHEGSNAIIHRLCCHLPSWQGQAVCSGQCCCCCCVWGCTQTSNCTAKQW